MEEGNLRYWNNLKTVPPEHLKKIEAGRLKGKFDISPQWRMQAMTKQFGPVGTGWKYEITKLWTEPGTGVEMCAFALVNIWYLRDDKTWSEPIPGIGGSMLIEQESKGPHTSDEAYKMAVTDAIGVAMKSIGVAAEVYLGLLETKYNKPAAIQGSSPFASPVSPPLQQPQPKQEPATTEMKTITVPIANVTMKKDTSKSTGKEFTKYTVTDSNLYTYATFSESFAKVAKEAKETGILCEIEYTTNKYGNNVTAIVLAPKADVVPPFKCPDTGGPVAPEICPLCEKFQTCKPE